MNTTLWSTPTNTDSIYTTVMVTIKIKKSEYFQRKKNNINWRVDRHSYEDSYRFLFDYSRAARLLP